MDVTIPLFRISQPTENPIKAQVAGRSLYEVQELLGHADIRTTSRYAHLSRGNHFHRGY